MKKIRLKKNVKKLLIITALVCLLLFIGIHYGIKAYKQKQYEKTYEYKLNTLGYTEKETSELLKTFKEKEIDYFLEHDVNRIYLEIAHQKYFIYDRFYDYLELLNNGRYSIEEVIERVNTNRDKEYYTNTIKTDINKKELLLVNKYYYLDEDYTPKDLVTIPQTYAYGTLGSQKVTKDTYDAYIEMWNASHEEGFYLMVSSSYRTYEEQQAVYDEYKTKQGIEYADSVAARPGHSEHQTGYCLDIFEKGYTMKTFANSDSYAWLKENAYKYGFIERYPSDKEDITGYSFESWHYRYVGVDAATYIHNNNITFDEYYAYFVK